MHESWRVPDIVGLGRAHKEIADSPFVLDMIPMGVYEGKITEVTLGRSQLMKKVYAKLRIEIQKPNGGDPWVVWYHSMPSISPLASEVHRSLGFPETAEEMKNCVGWVYRLQIVHKSAPHNPMQYYATPILMERIQAPKPRR